MQPLFLAASVWQPLSLTASNFGCLFWMHPFCSLIWWPLFRSLSLPTSFFFSLCYWQSLIGSLSPFLCLRLWQPSKWCPLSLVASVFFSLCRLQPVALAASVWQPLPLAASVSAASVCCCLCLWRQLSFVGLCPWHSPTFAVFVFGGLNLAASVFGSLSLWQS